MEQTSLYRSTLSKRDCLDTQRSPLDLAAHPIKQLFSMRVLCRFTPIPAGTNSMGSFEERGRESLLKLNLRYFVEKETAAHRMKSGGTQESTSAGETTPGFISGNGVLFFNSVENFIMKRRDMLRKVE